MYGEEEEEPSSYFLFQRMQSTSSVSFPPEEEIFVHSLSVLLPAEIVAIFMEAGFRVEFSKKRDDTGLSFLEGDTFTQDIRYCQKKTAEIVALFEKEEKKRKEAEEAPPLQGAEYLEKEASGAILDAAGLIYAMMVQIAPCMRSVSGSLGAEENEGGVKSFQLSSEVQEAFDLIVRAQKAVEKQRALSFLEIQKILDRDEKELNETALSYKACWVFMERLEEHASAAEAFINEVQAYLGELLFTDSTKKTGEVLEKLLGETFLPEDVPTDPVETQYCLVCEKKDFKKSPVESKVSDVMRQCDLVRALKSIQPKRLSEILMRANFSVQIKIRKTLARRQEETALRMFNVEVMKIYQEALENFCLITQEQKSIFSIKLATFKRTILKAKYFFYAIQAYIARIEKKKEEIIKKQKRLRAKYRAIEKSITEEQKKHESLLRETLDVGDEGDKILHEEPGKKAQDLIASITKKCGERDKLEQGIHQSTQDLQELLPARTALRGFLKGLAEKIQEATKIEDRVATEKYQWQVLQEKFFEKGLSIDTGIPPTFDQEFLTAFGFTKKVTEEMRQFLRDRLNAPKKILDAGADYESFATVAAFFYKTQEALKVSLLAGSNS